MRKILIANRGEIALRIARTCREMGIFPAAIYSDDDRDAPHVRCCDEAVAIGESYRDIERVIDAARKLHADAIHPGYGFLSENAQFAEACERARIRFIGPTSQVIRKMGLKSAARQIATGAGVPVVPACTIAKPRDFPLLIKADAGGGGRGLRIVTSLEQFHAALESAGSEALRSFGDGSLLIERYIPNARHVEFQIFGDHHGNLMHLFERDCSMQRRHQKIVEESPSPALDDDLRRRMGEAAVTIGKAIGYTNAGTVEFLVAPTGEFYFIEVNTRIQVEHPVTELITGLDLVRLQIEIAEGKRLPAAPRAMGHAIEARLYAEDPANGFLPASGRILKWRGPQNVRVDTALEDGAEIGIRYDSLLAKIVSHGMDREAALRKLIHALRSTVALGVTTNRDYLVQVLDSPEFREGRAHTAFLPPLKQDHEGESARIAAAVLYQVRSIHGIPANYRNNPYRDPRVKLRLRGQEIEVSWKRLGNDEYSVACGARTHACRVHARGDGGRISVSIDGITSNYEVQETPTHFYIHSPAGDTTVERLPRHPRPLAASQRESANSPMPGQVLRILVREGQSVKAGDSLVVLEAMKMEQTIRTTINGRVQSILVQTGQVVAPGQMLVQIGAEENA